MYDFLKLKKEVSETTADIEPDDVLSVKKKLKDLGYYQEPAWGITNFTDNQMFDGIRSFQTDNKLQVDGVMKPEGETEAKINERIKTERLINKGIFSNVYSQGYKIGERVANTRISAERKADILAKKPYNDKYKHSLLSCEEAQKGSVEAVAIAAGGLYKEYKDQKLGKNTISESIADLKADAYGIYKGIFNSKGNCDELVREKYKKHFGK